MATDARRFKKAITPAHTTHPDLLGTSGGTMAGNLSFGDEDKLIFGDDGDLEIYHTATGNETHIQGKNSRPVHIRAKDFYVTNGAGTEKAIYVDGAVGGGGYTSVKLYYDDVEKFKTSATGFEFTGITSEGLNMLGTLSTSPVDIDLSLGNIALGYCDGTDITFTFSGYDETVGNSNSFTLITRSLTLRILIFLLTCFLLCLLNSLICSGVLDIIIFLYISPIPRLLNHSTNSRLLFK